MKKISSKALREGAMMVALTAVLILLTRYMPIFTAIGTIILGIPMAALAARNGLGALIPALVCVFVISMFIYGEIFSPISLMLMSVIPGVVSGYMLGRKRGFFTALFAASGGVCLGWLFELVMVELILDNGIDAMFAQVAGQVSEMMTQMLKSVDTKSLEAMGISPGQFADTFIKTVVDITRLYFPCFVVISSMVTGYIILRISAFVIRRANLCQVAAVPFSEIKAPKSISWVAVLCFLIHIFTKNGTAVWGLFANIVTILYFILGVCGLSLIDFKLKTKIRSGALRMLIYFTAFLFGGMLLRLVTNILIIIGILDSTRDFRHLEFKET